MNDNADALKVAVADSSAIVRSGLAAVLRRLPRPDIHPTEVVSPEALDGYLRLHVPDAIVVSPAFGGRFDLAAFRAEHASLARVKLVALVSSAVDGNVLKEYDDIIGICDGADLIASKFERMLRAGGEEEDGGAQEVLSQREREIVTCIVKGMTNKAIADCLCLSIHTVITHRRNIARKLQIHSPAGLTIYAIANKLVELEDIKGQL